LFSDSISAGKMRSIIGNLETSSVEIQSITKDLSNIITSIENDKSAINYLVNDTTLTRQIEETMFNIQEGTERFNENMEALKHNFLTRGYFKKQERLERKKAKED
jgi:phospholipid/cholesterol/gamma-HCH transport system substrate-binding protein